MMLRADIIFVKHRLSGISAALQPGQITAICGPNGAGKSTLIQCLAGLLAPDSGAVSLGGKPIAAFHPQERAKLIGYLPQTGEVAWDVSVRSLAALGRLPHRDARMEPVDAALTALELDALADRPISRLSGGERARALLARVLAGEPHWILADEPLAALDLRHQLSLLGHLRREANRGTGVVLVLHDLALAMNHADHVLVLDQGSLVLHGPANIALAPDIIEQVWGVAADWLGDLGARALSARTVSRKN